MQKARGQGLRPSHCLSAHGFRIYFTRHLACFSPFPHGTRALSVIEEYLGLEGGPPRFAQNYPCSALLGIPLGVVGNRLPGFHRLWRPIPWDFGWRRRKVLWVLQPRPHEEDGLGWAPFARRY